MAGGQSFSTSSTLLCLRENFRNAPGRPSRGGAGSYGDDSVVSNLELENPKLTPEARRRAPLGNNLVPVSITSFLYPWAKWSLESHSPWTSRRSRLLHVRFFAAPIRFR